VNGHIRNGSESLFLPGFLPVLDDNQLTLALSKWVHVDWNPEVFCSTGSNLDFKRVRAGSCCWNLGLSHVHHTVFHRLVRLYPDAPLTLGWRMRRRRRRRRRNDVFLEPLEFNLDKFFPTVGEDGGENGHSSDSRDEKSGNYQRVSPRGHTSRARGGLVGAD